VNRSSCSPVVDDTRDYGEVIEETETASGAAAETNANADQQDTEVIHAGANGIEHVNQGEAQQQVRIDEQRHCRTLSDTT
jgi:hypothetical protein